MSTIINFVYVMSLILFIAYRKIFFRPFSKFSFSLPSLYTTIYHVLVMLFYYLWNLNRWTYM